MIHFIFYVVTHIRSMRFHIVQHLYLFVLFLMFILTVIFFWFHFELVNLQEEFLSHLTCGELGSKCGTTTYQYQPPKAPFFTQLFYTIPKYNIIYIIISVFFHHDLNLAITSKSSYKIIKWILTINVYDFNMFLIFNN